MGTLSFVRLETIHPILVHFTIGVVPLLLLAYGVAAWRGSERWAFAGDVIAIAGAAISLFTMTFGLVSNATVDWPGGLGTWRYLHLCFGIASTVLLAAIAAGRVIARRRGATKAGSRALIAVGAVSLLILFTGWLGGEVLVYHSGIAVTAAGEGALAPPVTSSGAAHADDIHDAMGHVRAAWAASLTTLGTMLVHHPSPEGFARIEGSGKTLQQLADWLHTEGAQHVAAHGGSSQKLASMAAELGQQSQALQQAARTRDLAAISHTMGDLGATCAGCHEAFKWKGEKHGD